MWYFFIKRLPTDVVCIVNLFLLDLSSLNKDILFLSWFFNAYDCTLHYLECCPLYTYSSHSPTSPHISIRCSFQTLLYSLKSAYACHSFVTTVMILSQICDDCVTAARQQKWTYHFLKNLHFLKWETYISNKTQYNHCFCKCCSHPHGRIHAHTYHFLKNLHLLKWETYISKKLYVTIAFVSVVHILTVEYMLTQKNHCTLSSQ